MKTILASTNTFFGNVIQTLLWENLLVYALSFYISMIMYNFFDSLVKDIFLPILSKVLPSNILDNDKNTLDGLNFLKETINLSIACYVTYVSIKFIKKHQKK